MNHGHDSSTCWASASESSEPVTQLMLAVVARCSRSGACERSGAPALALAAAAGATCVELPLPTPCGFVAAAGGCMLVAAPRGCCTGGMFSSGIHALGPLGAGEDIVRVELSTVIVALVVGGVHALQADGSSSTVWSGIAEMKSSRPRLGFLHVLGCFYRASTPKRRASPPPRACACVKKFGRSC